MSRLTLWITLLLSPLSASVHAKTLNVKKGGKFPTIQLAVNAATPGDRIVVAAGVYQENVIIPVGLSDLTIEGNGKVILDAAPQGAGTGGAGIEILADLVTLEDIDIRNADSVPGSVGDGVRVEADDVTLRGLLITASNDDGIEVEGARARIESCVIRQSVTAIEIRGDDATLRKVKVFRCDDFGVDIDGDRARVEELLIRGVEDEGGLEISGDDAVVVDCVIDNVQDRLLDVTGDDALIEGNDLKHGDSSGISVNGDRAVIRDNRVLGVGSTGIRASGLSVVVEDNQVDGARDLFDISGDLPTIRGNTGKRAIDDSEGIRVSNTPSGGLISDNKISVAASDGVFLAINCVGLLIERNVVKGSGFEFEPAFRLQGSGHVVRENVAKNCGEGFRVLGNGMLLEKNAALKCDRDGFDVEESSSNIELRENIAKGNAAEGIENEGVATSMVKNEAEDNRIDLANSGTLVQFSGNQFETGGQNTPPQID